MSDAFLASLAGYIGGFIVFAVAVWFVAPPVGGEFWPYIRAVAALVGGSVGAGVGQLVALGFLFAKAVVT